MKFLHTGDWHIGKKLNGYDLLEEQQDVFRQLMAVAEKEQVDAIVIAGDLYDRSVPSVEAVEVFNWMMREMNIEKKYPVLAISGNHDSSTRLETGGPWYEPLRFHLHTRLEQGLAPVEIDDTQFFLLPYFEPFAARRYFEDDSLKTIQQAVAAAVAEMEKRFDPHKKQVLVSHFFIAGSTTTDSETKVTVGGLDVVPLSLLENFDYVALGHLHNRHALHSDNVRYSGSLLKYSLSEVNQEKGVWVVELTDTETNMEFFPVTPMRDVKVLEESFDTLMTPSFYSEINREDYIGIRLTNKEVIPNVMNQLRSVYPRIIQLERAHGRTAQELNVLASSDLQKKDPLTLFADFFETAVEQPLTIQQKSWLEEEYMTLEKEG
ncbi:exonuclease SbcCD subunit D [Vagococcus elongatus]|uniref:Nuclease SbcCD subunit D n=1 Tax=Vagococcus elongatus TaxID=180344 RepID=A0A430B153_9ENTE|nr:exonuclease SbcCD subunit D [Vagococcus elongatus]RSU14073.1 exonuclease sbcCD subunit D [Vagococcus elongatus]